MASGSRGQEGMCPADGDRNKKRKACALDFDTLDCPICLESLTCPVFQCQNGHTACGGCCRKLTGGLCPSCSLPIGANRCIVVEKIIESLQLHCKYAVWGCKKMLQFNRRKKEEHEVVCKFCPYQCPVLGCNRECPKSGLPDHILNNHNGKIVHYDDPDDEIKNSFTISTDDVAYDRSHSQYVIVRVSGDVLGFDPEDSEDEDSEDEDSDEQDFEELLLVHHQFHEKYCRYSFSLTSFGSVCPEYRLSVNVEREGPRPGRTRRTFKGNYSIEGPVHDNQIDKALLSKVVRQGDCLFVPKLSASKKDSSKFEVEFQIVPESRSL